MKKAFIHSLIAVLSIICACHADDKIINPGFFLNHQDVPIFSDNNPLAGMKHFLVVPTCTLDYVEMEKSMKDSIEKSLETVGKVTHLKNSDMRGFGAGNVLMIQIDSVKAWDGSETSISRLSLSVETFVTLKRTGIKTFPMVWSINSFLQNPVDSSSEGNQAKAIQKLVGDFIQNYRYANQGQVEKPVFYIYD